MDFKTISPATRRVLAYTLPMGLFLALLALNSGLKQLGRVFWLSSAEYWLYPVQTLLCGALLVWFRREYCFDGFRRVLFALAVAVFVFVLWIAPQAFLGAAPRLVGFNPEIFGTEPALYWATVLFRFLRLAVVVPLVEEIFWRGFLLRYFIEEDFERVPLGGFSWLSFSVVTLGFTFAHARADWIAAAMTGALYNCVAYRTKSLASCVLTHAVTNLLLGLWIMRSGQWGFW